MHFRGVLFICHGIGDHSLWYEDLADILVKIGFYVFTHDHGRPEVHLQLATGHKCSEIWIYYQYYTRNALS